jgi:hypothetical protein
MGERQPLGEVLGGFVRRLPIKGHHRRRHAVPPPQLRTPSVADGHDLDLVRAPANHFFKSMNGHVIFVREEDWSRRVILRIGRARASEAAREGSASSDRSGQYSRNRVEKKFDVAVSQQDFHVRSTGFPQGDWKMPAFRPIRSTEKRALGRRVQCDERVQ